MPTSSGINTIFGVARETTHGTHVAPTQFNELVRETMRPNRPRVMSKGMRPGRYTEHRVATGPTSVSGDIVTELYPEQTGTLLRNMLGAPVSSTETSNGSGVYDHVFNPASIDQEWMSVTLARPTFDGARETYEMAGCQTTSWGLELSAGQDGFVMLTQSLYGAGHEDGTVPSNPTYQAASEQPFYWTGATVSVAGNVVDVTSLTINCDNMLKTDRHFIRGAASDVPRPSLQNGYRKYTFSISQDFYEDDIFGNFLQDQQVVVQAVLSNGANERLTIQSNAFIADVTGPNTSGPEMLTFGADFEALHATADATAFTFTLRNSETTVI